MRTDPSKPLRTILGKDYSRQKIDVHNQRLIHKFFGGISMGSPTKHLESQKVCLNHINHTCMFFFQSQVVLYRPGSYDVLFRLARPFVAGTVLLLSLPRRWLRGEPDAGTLRR